MVPLVSAQLPALPGRDTDNGERQEPLHMRPGERTPCHVYLARSWDTRRRPSFSPACSLPPPHLATDPHASSVQRSAISLSGVNATAATGGEGVGVGMSVVPWAPNAGRGK